MSKKSDTVSIRPKDRTMLNAIADTVRDAHGISVAMAVYAALKVAAKEWEYTDTMSYGEDTRDLVESISNGIKMKGSN